MSFTALSVSDPAGVSLTHFLVFVFPQKRARAQAIELARAAAVFAESDVQGRPSYFAAFDKTPEQASFALRLQSYLRNRDYVDQYAGGKLLDNRHKNGVIACYRDALRCGDTRAHCHTVESRHDIFLDPARSAERIYADVMEEIAVRTAPVRYLFPCRFLREQRFQIDVDHPVKDPVALIRGAAVRFGCEWCPLFDASAFRELAGPP